MKKTINQIIVESIVSDRSPTGSSRQSIAKILKASEYAELDVPVIAKKVAKALKKLVAEGKVVQVKQSFTVPGHEFEDTSPKVEIVEIREGEGQAVEAGDNIDVGYVGKLDDDTVFDRAKSFSFCVQGGEVIKGWDIGVVGMKVGGERRLTVPSELGYGKKGSGPEIPPSSTLHFKIKLNAIL
jgi:FK506-binding nuclear protein